VQLTDEQLHDAFATGGLGNEESRGYIEVLRQRIRQLNDVTVVARR
jgi:hypothetical protein